MLSNIHVLNVRTMTAKLCTRYSPGGSTIVYRLVLRNNQQSSSWSIVIYVYVSWLPNAVGRDQRPEGVWTLLSDKRQKTKGLQLRV